MGYSFTLSLHLKSLHLSLSKHSLLASSTPLIPHSPRSLMYSFTLSLHLKSLHLSLAKHSLLASSTPLIPHSPHSLMYSFTLSLHLKGGLPLLLGPSTSLMYTFFTNSPLFILSTCPNH